MKPLKLKQLVIAPFSAPGFPLSYSTLGLGIDGVVYRYDPKCEGWIPWNMQVVGCRSTHKAKR
jgi:hypothetical protein